MVVVLDDVLDLPLLVPVADEKEGRVLPDTLELGLRDLELLHARDVAAFAENSQPFRGDLKRVADALDALVHLAEQRLVQPDLTLALADVADPIAGR